MRLHRAAGGAVALVFAIFAVPLCMFIGLAVDFGFYIQAQAQLGLAADAGTMQAVKIASAAFTAGQSATAASSAGAAAALQWFQTQEGTLLGATLPTANINPSVTFNASTSAFNAVITWQATVPTHFGGLFGINQWTLSGASHAIITTNSFAEIDMLIDNSSSMLIGATPTDIRNIQLLTICAPTHIAQVAGQSMIDYAWVFPTTPINYGYGTYTVGVGNAAVTLDQVLPLSFSTVGSCDSNFTGDATECAYPPYLTQTNHTGPGVNTAGLCPTGTGIPDPGNLLALPNPILPRIDLTTLQIANLPQAPCGLACHTDTGSDDYYTLVRSSNLGIKLRFDIIQSAAALVVNDMIAKQQVSNQFALGVYEFNAGLTQVHPTAGGTFIEADTNLSQGLADIAAIQTPIVTNGPNTNFPGAMTYLAANLAAGGDGSSATARRKNLFIVTDGLEDYSPSNRVIGVMQSSYCTPLKTLGYNIFVLYTPYYPLPNPFYLYQGARAVVEPSAGSAVAAALQACATLPSQYYQASDVAGINAAMESMLQSALNTPGRISQ